MKPSAAFTRRGLRALAVIALVLGTLAMRVVYSARQELAVAHGLLAGGDLDGAIVHYRRAARFYAPGSPYHVTALERLDRLAQTAEQHGEIERALSGYRAIRGSILATRSLYVPEPERLRAANLRIAALMAEQPAPGMDAGKSHEQLRAEHLGLLEAAPDPSLFWTCVLLFGFVAWVGAAFVFSVRAIDEHSRFVKAEARAWGTVIAVGFGLFALGMALA